MNQLNLSVGAYHRTQSVKLTRTIADLAGCDDIQPVHLAEALHLRSSEVKDGLIASFLLIVFNIHSSLPAPMRLN